MVASTQRIIAVIGSSGITLISVRVAEFVAVFVYRRRRKKAVYTSVPPPPDTAQI